MKIVNTTNNKEIAKIITNMSLTMEEALETVGIDLSQPDDEGAYVDLDGEKFWLEDCEEVEE